VLRVGGQELNIFSDPAHAFTEGTARLDHLCLEMEGVSIDNVTQALGQARVKVQGGPTRRSEGVSIFVHDPDGCRIELIVKG
jgi:catechol 2,3-dioxygenase-like lactoylglutathione lyase family enzyme